MPFDMIATNAPVIFVSNPAELRSAYEDFSTTNGGGKIQLTNDFPQNGVIELSNGGSQPVIVTSADPSNPVEVGRIILNNVDNVKFSDLHVDSVGMYVHEYDGDVDINNSSNIVLDSISYTSNGANPNNPAQSTGTDGGRAVTVTDSSDVTISNSVAFGYFQAITLVESSDVTIENNEIYGNQGDGIKLSEVSDILIKDNYLHDFAAIPNESNHGDFIQLHSGGSIQTTSSDVVITGNFLDTGNGTSLQGIWMRNEQYDSTGNSNHLYTGIVVSDNVIYTGSANAIGLGGSNGAIISNNTILFNEQAETITARGNTTYEPWLRLSDDARNALVQDNIAPRFLDDASNTTMTGNIAIEYDDRSDPNYVGNHFVNALSGGDLDLDDLQLLSGSSLAGKGASATQPGGSTDVAFTVPSLPEPTPEVDEEDDVEPAPEPVVIVEPVAPAPEPEPVAAEDVADDPIALDDLPFITPTPTPPQSDPIPIDSETLFAMDFTAGSVVDMSDFDSELKSASAGNLILEDDDLAYRIGGDKKIQLHVRNEHIHQLDSFGFEMEIRLLNPTDTGRFIHFHDAFHAEVEKDGTISFTLFTDQGRFDLNSDTQVFDDLEAHNFAVGYDSAAGLLALSIDGVVLDKVAASGTTAEGVYHGLTVGTAWGNSVEAVVDDIFFGTDPLDAGVDLSVEIGERIEIVEEPAEDAEQADIPLPPDNFEPLPEPFIPIDPSGAFFANDFEAGTVADLSGYDSRIKSADEASIVDNGDGNSFIINDDSALTLHKSNDQLHELDSFGLRLDVKLLEADDTGRFIHFQDAFQAEVEKDGTVSFTLYTDNGRFDVNSGETSFNDMEQHSFAVGYDSDAGRLTMEIDGEVVDSVAASGSTGSAIHHGLTIGSVWGNSLVAEVDNVWFGDSPEAVGVDTTDGVLFALLTSSIEPDSSLEAMQDDSDLLDDLAEAS